MGVLVDIMKSVVDASDLIDATLNDIIKMQASSDDSIIPQLSTDNEGD